MNNPADIRQWLFEEFSSRLAGVFEAMAGERPQIEIESIPDLPAEASLRWRQPFSGAAGAAWVVASEGAWMVAGGHVLKAAGIEENDAGSLKSTYLETVNQALSGVAGALGGRLAREVTCAAGDEASTPIGETAWASIKIDFGAEKATIIFGVEPALVTAMVATPHGESAQAKIVEAAAAAVAGTGITGPVNSRTFELLLDVELPVSVSFGRAQVPLKDVLKLTTGSIVELNRSILEPVEVIVNNCVIARGEVVVVEGNFGVRVHQVISRQERLRTLN
jgi:flagellar motor switch protein FliN/FliY